MIEWRLVITSHNLKSFNVASHYKAKELNLYTVRRSGLGVVSWTCDPVLALGQRFDSRRSFCCNPLGLGIYCTLPSLLGWDLKQEVPCLCTHHTAHTQDPISHFEKRVGLHGWWWWMTVHQHTREGNLLNPTKMCSLKNRLCLLRYAERPTSKMTKDGVEKRSQT